LGLRFGFGLGFGLGLGLGLGLGSGFALMSMASSSVHGAAEGERVPEPTTGPLSSRWAVSVAPSLAASRKWRGWSYETVPMASRTSSPLTVPFGQPTETGRELAGSGEGGASAGEASRPRERMRCTPACTPPLSLRAIPLAMPGQGEGCR